jgi:hypothetical protein
MASSKEEQARAEAQFHRTLKKAHEAKQAVSQYEADARAVAEKTARLRALRLAKEAAETKSAAEAEEAAVNLATIKKSAAKKKPASKKAASPGPEKVA